MSSVNTNKAGMERAPKEEINRIYEELTKNSTFTKVEKVKEQEYIYVESLYIKLSLRKIRLGIPKINFIYLQ